MGAALTLFPVLLWIAYSMQRIADALGRRNAIEFDNPPEEKP